MRTWFHAQSALSFLWGSVQLDAKVQPTLLIYDDLSVSEDWTWLFCKRDTGFGYKTVGVPQSKW